MNVLELIYLGRRLYFDSGTRIGVLYRVDENRLEKFDWSTVEIALERGEEVKIRPASDLEKIHFRMKLAEVKSEETV